MRHPRALWILMGCGTSKFNLMEEGITCGLKRRMVESHSKNELLDNHDPSTTSTTKLLLEDVQNHSRKSSLDSVVMKEPPLQPQIGKKEHNVERGKGEGERGTKKEERDEMDRDENERVAEANDIGRRISDFDGNWIGSPSFREYCVDSEPDQDDVNNDHRSNGEEETERKTQGTDYLASSDEVCVLPGPKRLEKKGSRGRKFIRVFPTMHKPKNLWHGNRNDNHVPIEKLQKEN